MSRYPGVLEIVICHLLYRLGQVRVCELARQQACKAWTYCLSPRDPLQAVGSGTPILPTVPVLLAFWPLNQILVRSGRGKEPRRPVRCDHFPLFLPSELCYYLWASMLSEVPSRPLWMWRTCGFRRRMGDLHSSELPSVKVLEAPEAFSLKRPGL